MILVNLLGTNGSGKSTRLNEFIDLLDRNTQPYNEIYSYLNGKNQKIGRLYTDSKIFILGKKNKKNIWNSLDLAHFTKLKDRIKLYNHIAEIYKCNYFIHEGYFNNISEQLNPNNLRNDKITNFIYLFFIYDDVSDFLNRTNSRTNKKRNLDWAINSPGWSKNEAFLKFYNNINKEKFTGDIIEKFSIYTDKNMLESYINY